jgi:hypothetical protein
MNLESLKTRVGNRITSVTLCDGEVVHLQKVSAKKGVEIGAALIAAGHADPNGKEPANEHIYETHVQVLSRSIVEQIGGEWVASLDSEEGRDILRQLEIGSLTQLGLIAQQWNGMGEAKKN